MSNALALFHIVSLSSGKHFCVAVEKSLGVDAAYAAARIADGQSKPVGQMVEYGPSVPAPSDATVVLVVDFADLNAAMDAAGKRGIATAKMLDTRFVVWSDTMVDQGDVDIDGEPLDGGDDSDDPTSVFYRASIPADPRLVRAIFGDAFATQHEADVAASPLEDITDTPADREDLRDDAPYAGESLIDPRD